MNLMIVEDEIGIRARMAGTIPWEENGIDVVALAENGSEALQMMERTRPDIIVLDIRMPEMDGLTLAKRIHESNEMVKMIILSGYEHFEYARSAMESGVLKYLIKPASNEEILQAVLEAAAILKSELEKRHNYEMLVSKWRNHLPRLQETFYNNCISGAFADWEYESRSKELLIPFEAERRLSVVVLEPDPLIDGGRFRAEDTPLLQFSLRSIAFDVISGMDSELFQDAKGSTVIIFHSRQEEVPGEFQLRVSFTTTKVLSTLKECLKVTASAGISSIATGLQHLPMLYAQAQNALRKRVVYGHDLAIPYADELGEDDSANLTIASDERALETGIELGDIQIAEAALDRLLEKVFGHASAVEEVQEKLLYLMHGLLRVIREQQWNLRQMVGEDAVYFYSVLNLHSREQIQQTLHRIVRKITTHSQKRPQPSGHKLIQRLLVLVDEEIGQDISLNLIADRLYVNKSYLSRLFKHEVGESFSQYVLKRKMTLAKQFIQEGGQVGQAARQVGYINSGFFSKVFQKYWGVLPSEIKQS